MLSRLHSKLGTAGLVVAIVALIAALTGAAFAAGGLTKQQEKQVKKIAKKYAGKRGPAGPQGPAGPAGAKGDKGDAGTPGANGKSVVTSAISPGGTCEAGGVAVEVEGSGTKKSVCNGANGGFSEEMESGTTLRGKWTIGPTKESSFGMTAISFLTDYPGEAAPTAVFVRSTTECSSLEEPFKGSCEANNAAAEAHCHGNAAEPAADPGFLCVYNQLTADQLFIPLVLPGKEGAIIRANAHAIEGVPQPLLMTGSWAVTAP